MDSGVSHIIYVQLNLKIKSYKGQIKLKEKVRKEIKIRAKINEIKNRETIEKINIVKICFFEKINNIYKLQQG